MPSRRVTDNWVDRRHPGAKGASSATCNNQAPPVDVAALLEQVVGNAALVDTAADLIVAQCAQDLQRIEQAIAVGDAAALADAAHTLKGAAAYFSAGAVHSAAAKLELLGRTSMLAHAAGLAVQLRSEVERLAAYLPEVRAQANRRRIA